MQIKLTRSLIPNLFTLMNMFCGFLSIINSFEGNFVYASVLIVVAAIFDLLDGLAARITKSASEFGVELDSLSDVISFGAAPAFLIYNIHLKSFYEVGVLISAFYLICVALRLARFNVQLIGFDKAFFYGLPSPLSAITVASYIISFYEVNRFVSNASLYFLPLVILVSILMVSQVKYDAFPKFNLAEFKSKPFYFLFLTAAFIIAILTEGKWIILLIAAFILYGIVRAIIAWIFKSSEEKSSDDLDEFANFDI
ncbi:MAG: CDP-diacylglycerol--serine O-phosphatidyltransferase [Ignavibacteria bacterium]|nr:CDP-diacylglycerol--serine O-phosphatidyltransferase [Ignavibacteria bacterium]